MNSRSPQPPTNQIFGSWLRFQRQQRDLTQIEFAHLLGCARSTIAKFEQGLRRPSKTMLIHILDVLEVPIAERTMLVQQTRQPQAQGSAPQLPQPSSVQQLPVIPTLLIGRDADLEALSALVQHGCRMISIVGPPGIGKTRTAIALGHRLANNFPGGAVFLPLARIHDAEQVADFLSQRLQIRHIQSISPNEALISHLRTQTPLLIVDNMEHVLAAASLITELVECVPDIVIVATSRMPLRIYGEHIYDLTPLPVNHDASNTLSPAVELFVSRAQAVQHSFTLNDLTTPNVVAICQLLDGLPLALELAAAQVRSLDLGSLYATLQTSLAPLHVLFRDREERQQSMYAALMWSYQRLSSDAQILLRWMSIAPSGWTDQTLRWWQYGVQESSLQSCIAELHEANLLRLEEEFGVQYRWRMLYVIRSFADALITDPTEKHAVWDHLAKITLAHSSYLAHQLDGTEQIAVLYQFREELPTMIRVLSWLLNNNRLHDALELVANLGSLWNRSGRYSEGEMYLHQVLCQIDYQCSEARAVARRWLGTFQHFQGHFAEAQVTLFSALEDFQALDHTVGCGHIYNTLGMVASDQNHYADAQQWYIQSRDVWITVDDTFRQAIVQLNLATIYIRQGQYDVATTLLQECIDIFTAVEHQVMCCIALCNLAWSLTLLNQFDDAFVVGAKAYALAQDLGDLQYQGNIANSLGYLAFAQGNLEATIVLARYCIDCHIKSGYQRGQISNLLLWSHVLCAKESWKDAAKMLGVVDKWFKTVCIHPEKYQEEHYHQIEKSIKERLDLDVFDAAFMDGTQASYEIACRDILDGVTVDIPILEEIFPQATISIDNGL